jgi:DNA-binding LytR/AlgR family response regulator
LFLVPDRAREQSILMQGALEASMLTEIPELAEAHARAASAIAGLGSNETELGRGTYAPLGGAGAPPPRIARRLPIERDGATHFIAVEDVVAIHANAHYTYIFNGTDKLFCPLGIGEIESRLDKSLFARIHRSHIINIERVIGYRRSGDSDMVEMAATDHYAVPISRSRVSWLKSRIGVKLG